MARQHTVATGAMFGRWGAVKRGTRDRKEEEQKEKGKNWTRKTDRQTDRQQECSSSFEWCGPVPELFALRDVPEETHFAAGLNGAGAHSDRYNPPTPGAPSSLLLRSLGVVAAYTLQ